MVAKSLIFGSYIVIVCAMTISYYSLGTKTLQFVEAFWFFLPSLFFYSFIQFDGKKVWSPIPTKLYKKKHLKYDKQMVEKKMNVIDEIGKWMLILATKSPPLLCIT